MATAKQVAANQCNALKSTGPRSERGKLQSRKNAVRHGLTAETVVTVLEDAEEYAAFEATLVEEYHPQTVIQHQLVTRLASLFWRLRRAASIETGLFQIQGKNILDRRAEQSQDAPGSVDGLPSLQQTFKLSIINSSKMQDNDSSATHHHVNIAQCFLRLATFNDGMLERINYYEIRLWRQATQIMTMLDSVR